MIFKAHQTIQSLAPFVKSIFHYKDFYPDHSIERVIPTGHLFIIFELDDLTRHTYDNKNLKPNGTYRKAWVSGMHKNHISISAHQNSEMFVIQLEPYGGFPFIHRPIEQLNERVIPAEEIFGPDILAFRNNILSLEKSEDKFQACDHWLSDHFDPHKVPPPDLVNFVTAQQSNPVSQLPEIMAKYPRSQKHLIHLFKKYIGLTPKWYQRILRFNDLLKQIQNKENIAWADIAYRCGYTDQSHFIKEFKHFSGFNPREFIKKDFQQDEANFFPLDRKG